MDTGNNHQKGPDLSPWLPEPTQEERQAFIERITKAHKGEIDEELMKALALSAHYQAAMANLYHSLGHEINSSACIFCFATTQNLLQWLMAVNEDKPKVYDDSIPMPTINLMPFQEEEEE